jgi:16S rRNA (uracil1498-N3)-methyltransferase
LPTFGLFSGISSSIVFRMTERYFSDQPLSSGRAVLGGPEAHHLIHVMRAAPGMRVVLFDGHGAEFPAVVQQVGRSEVDLSVVSRDEVNRELPIDLTLGVALPKGDRQKWLVEKAVELGVTRIAPLRTDRGVAQPVEQALQRLRRTVVEASKQCGRNRLLQIEEPRNWSDFVEASANVTCRLLAHPHGACTASDLSVIDESPDCVFLAVGPEGGFTDEEVALATAAGWRTIDLGPRILRVETAALALSAMVVQRLVR